MPFGVNGLEEEILYKGKEKDGGQVPDDVGELSEEAKVFELDNWSYKCLILRLFSSRPEDELTVIPIPSKMLNEEKGKNEICLNSCKMILNDEGKYTFKAKGYFHSVANAYRRLFTTSGFEGIGEAFGPKKNVLCI